MCGAALMAVRLADRIGRKSCIGRFRGGVRILLLAHGLGVEYRIADLGPVAGGARPGRRTAQSHVSGRRECGGPSAHLLTVTIIYAVACCWAGRWPASSP